MIRMATLIETFKKPLLAQYRDHMLPGQIKALAAMERCRTASSARLQAACPECDEHIFVPHSCGHRSCPHCQAHESQRWIERQTRKRVPGEYFLLTFTLPAELRPLAFGHQRQVYDLMMQTSWEVIKTFSASDKTLQGTPGAVTVLHTHTRRLDYHPHVHLVMPAGAIDTRRRLWRAKRGHGKSPYLFNHTALAKVFRAKMLAAFAAADLMIPSPIPQKWVVDCKPVGTGAKALVYLGRYLYRGVIQEKDILTCENGQVTFRYRNAKTRKTERRTVSGVEFLRLMLAHVLPKGLRRARNFGFLHANSKRLIALLQTLAHLIPPSVPITQRPALCCPCCGKPMVIVRTRIPPARSSSPPVGAPAGVPIM